LTEDLLPWQWPDADKQRASRPGLFIAEDDLVAIHCRIRGWDEDPKVVMDIFRVKGGKLAAQRDVLQNKAARASGAAGAPMFDPGENSHRLGSVCDELALRQGGDVVRKAANRSVLAHLRFKSSDDIKNRALVLK
jgi:hypothetical protein